MTRNYWLILPLLLAVGGCDGQGGSARRGKPDPAVLLPGVPEAPVTVEIPSEPDSAGATPDLTGLTVATPDGAGAQDGAGGAGDAGGDAGAGSQKQERPADSAFVGLKLEQAEALAKQHKIRARVVMVDGEAMMVTQDYSPERLNFTVEKGVVTKVTRG